MRMFGKERGWGCSSRKPGEKMLEELRKGHNAGGGTIGGSE